jgi:hypothetical protein
MAQKCVHQACGKTYTDPEEPCQYHPGPPIFHEGQKGKASRASGDPSYPFDFFSFKAFGQYFQTLNRILGWKCCKPRVLTFEEFLSIAPCTEGRHSTTDLPPKIEKPPSSDTPDLISKLESLQAAATAPARTPVAPRSAAATPPPESDEDDASLEIPDGKACRRRACGKAYKAGQSRDGEECVYHPGVPIFHEGSKGYTCCKRRVLEFDQFMKIEGCEAKNRHLFVGSGKKDQKPGHSGGEEKVDNVR